ncbi:progranulin isoform X3 [Trachemys scripta elegans]|uniref:progranulin isoform X3 n=1 Tax=Trachemys scripta elegans TaxID=31138 RepID=UPI0015563111|nr:progranulin isoform X3 [Trachemys scripta elegans]
MWSLVPLWLALSGAVASPRCPDGRLCQGLDVCCRDPGEDGYACCPPSLGSPASLPMTQASSMAKPAGSVCPDGTQCPAEYSCLRVSAGSFSCCPLSEAVACADGHHCCPRGSHCSADGKSCFVLPGLPAAGAVQCPDGESECPNESTCCMMPTGSWGCCPMPQAACCADKVHCCPHATTCDLERARCLSAAGEQPLGSKVPAQKRVLWQGMPVSLSAITCPDHRSVCPDGTTCCQLSASQYGCCPLQNAVCCSDRLHCCPQGTTCDLPHSQCASTLGQTQLLTRLLDTAERAREVRCDEQTSCPDGCTCCRKSTGAWACCPLLEAVCCQDHVHCCPKGHTCDPAGGRCQPPAAPIPWLEKTPARVRALSTGRDVQCDEQTSCPDGNTCCRLSTGAWGCCPLVEAVCCQDHVHCCPKGHKCDPAGKCQQALLSVPWAPKAPAHIIVAAQSRGVKCNQTVSCEDGQTCCKSGMGSWACCHLPNAVCCEDHQHCCPSGYTCDLATQSCEKHQAGRVQPVDLSLSASLLPASPEPSNDVTCDAQHYCHAHQTCCKAASGTWACCPYRWGSCCSDMRHCCPFGYRCSKSGLDCKRRWLLRWDAGAPRPHPLL